MNQTAMGVKVLLDFANEVDRYLGEKRVKSKSLRSFISFDGPKKTIDFWRSVFL